MRLVVFAVVAGLVSPACRRQEPPREVVEDMVAIPGGEFLGQRIACPKLHTDRADVRQTVAAYQIDRRVVQCDDYAACVAAGACAALDPDGCTANIVGAKVKDATAYCAWRGAQIATYAQWSRAIRGVEGHRYPTGETWDETRGCQRRTTTRSSLPRCEHVSAAGVEFAVQTYFSGEWTRDVGCNENRSGAAVADLIGVELDRVRFAQSPAEFRCSREVAPGSTP